MNHQTLSKILLAAAAVFVTGLVAPNTQAGCKSKQCCPKCDHVCKLDAEKVDVEKTCFEVESDYICIPRVVFPWQRPAKKSCGNCAACDGSGCKSCSACPNNGACVRKIKVLKTKKYKCPECEYTWSAEKVDGCGCGGSSCGGCGDGSCGDGCCDAGCCDAGCSSAGASLPPAIDMQGTATSPAEYQAAPAMLAPMPAAVPAPVYSEQIPSATDYYLPAPPQN